MERTTPSLSNVRCLVLGAGGFLGKALSTALCDHGAVVRGYGRNMGKGRGIDSRVLLSTGEFSDFPALARAVDGQEIVFHLLGSSTAELSSLAAEEDLAQHLSWTVRLLDVCHDANIRKLMFASSGGAVYGIPAIIPTPETAATEPISAYGINRLAIEKYLALYQRRYGLDYQVLRIGNAYGPGQSPFRKQGVVAATLHRALSGRPLEIWGSGKTTRDFIHVDDVMTAFVHAVHYSGEHRVMNVGTGEGHSLDDLVADVERLLNIPGAAVVRKPGRLVDVPVSILATDLIRAVTAWRPRIRWFDGLSATAGWIRTTYGL